METLLEEIVRLEIVLSFETSERKQLMMERKQFVMDMVRFCEMQIKTWDGVIEHERLKSKHQEKDESNEKVRSGKVPSHPVSSGEIAGGLPRVQQGQQGRRVREPRIRREDVRNFMRIMAPRFWHVAQIALLLFLAKTSKELMIAAGIYAGLVLLGIPGLLRAHVGNQQLDAVLGRLKVRLAAKNRIDETLRRLENGEEVTEADLENFRKDSEFLSRENPEWSWIFRFLYQLIGMFFLTAIPGMKFNGELLK
jgi:hypothetical protein